MRVSTPTLEHVYKLTYNIDIDDSTTLKSRERSEKKSESKYLDTQTLSQIYKFQSHIEFHAERFVIGYQKNRIQCNF